MTASPLLIGALTATLTAPTVSVDFNAINTHIDDIQTTVNQQVDDAQTAAVLPPDLSNLIDTTQKDTNRNIDNTQSDINKLINKNKSAMENAQDALNKKGIKTSVKYPDTTVSEQGNLPPVLDGQSKKDSGSGSGSESGSGSGSGLLDGIPQWKIDRFDQLAQCESGGNWSINTSNGYYGGLQINPQTFSAFGGKEFGESADKLTREQQIYLSDKIQKVQGWGAWPSCSKKYGYI